MSKFQSCKYIEHGMVLDLGNMIRDCCQMNPRYGGRPVIYNHYLGEKIDWTNFFEIKNKKRLKFRNNDCPNECTNCIMFEEKEWDNDDYIDYLLMTPWYKCNARCIYCGCDSKDLKNTSVEYSVYDIVEDMINSNIIKKDGTIDFAGGEPTINKEFDKLLNLFLINDFKNIIIHTNAIKYKDIITKGIRQNKINILVSVDSGTKKTHKTIRQVDSHDVVWRNLKKYAEAQNEQKTQIKTKYIICPGINDSKEEIRLWLEKSSQTGIKKAVLNMDYNWVNNNIDNIPENLYELIEYTYKTAEEYEIDCQLYGNIAQIKREVESNPHFNKK